MKNRVVGVFPERKLEIDLQTLGGAPGYPRVGRGDLPGDDTGMCLTTEESVVELRDARCPACTRAKVVVPRNGKSFCQACGCDFQAIIDRTPDDVREDVEERLRQALQEQSRG